MTVIARKHVVVAACVVLLGVTSGCATPTGGDRQVLVPPTAPPIVVGTGTVIDVGGAPQLCPFVLESYPPQCGEGIDLTGWTWDGVEGSETASGVTWGDYAVQGNIDGDALSVIGTPVPLALYDPAPYTPSDDPAQRDLDERFGGGFLRLVDPDSD